MLFNVFRLKYYKVKAIILNFLSHVHLFILNPMVSVQEKQMNWLFEGSLHVLHNMQIVHKFEWKPSFRLMAP